MLTREVMLIVIVITMTVYFIIITTNESLLKPTRIVKYYSKAAFKVVAELYLRAHTLYHN